MDLFMLVVHMKLNWLKKAHAAPPSFVWNLSWFKEGQFYSAAQEWKKKQYREREKKRLQDELCLTSLSLIGTQCVWHLSKPAGNSVSLMAFTVAGEGLGSSAWTSVKWEHFNIPPTCLLHYIKKEILFICEPEHRASGRVCECIFGMAGRN